MARSYGLLDRTVNGRQEYQPLLDNTATEKDRIMSETIVAATTLPGWTTGRWTIDPAHSQVGFAVRHLMSKVRGTFDTFSGEIVTGSDPTQSTVTAVVELSSVNTGLQMRDDHLRSGEFFDIEQNPKLTFASTALRQDGDRWVLRGDLTIKDITQPVELKIEYLGIDPTGVQGETRIGFEARTTINRGDFGVSFGLVADGSKILVGNRVDVTLDIEAFLQD
jgi:polyisoprenoid-binding protein YceI